MWGERTVQMLNVIIVVLILIWLLGVGTSYTAGGLLHLVLVIAVIILVVRLLEGRRL